MWVILFVHPKRHPKIRYAYAMIVKTHSPLLPLLGTDDLGIEAREVLVDLVFAVVLGSLKQFVSQLFWS